MGFAVIFLLPLTLICMGGCYWNEPPPKDTIVFAVGESPKTLDPRFATDATGQRMSHLLFSSLVQLDENLELKGDLSTHWTYENLEYTFYLKPHILFHNGQKLQRKDFIFSFEQFRKETSLFASAYRVISSIIVDYSFETGGEIKITLQQFSPSFLMNLRLIKIMPAEVVQEKPQQFTEFPVGSGPFKLKALNSHSVVLVRNKDYYDQKPLSENLHFKVIKDSTTRFLKMYKGQVDIVQSDIPFSKIDFFRKENEFEVITRPGLSTTYLLLNNRKDPLNQKVFRQALAQAINVDEIIKFALNGYADPANSLLPFSLSEYNQNLEASPRIKPQKVQDLFTNKTIELKTSNNFQALENGQIIAEQLRQKGLNVKMKSFEWGTYYGDIKAGRFEMAIMKWVGVLLPDIYRNTLHSREFPPGRNRGYYNNTAFDQIVDKAFYEKDEGRRVALYHKAQQIIFNDKPVIPLWHEKQVAIINKRVKNYLLPLDGSFSSLTKVFKEHD